MTVIGFPRLNRRFLALPTVREMLISGYPVAVIADVHREWVNGADPSEALLARLEQMTPEERAAHEARAEAFSYFRTWRWTEESWRETAPFFVSYDGGRVA